MISPQDAKEAFSDAYVRAVAAVSRVVISEANYDVGSVDLTLVMNGVAGAELRNPKLDLQLKCTETVDLGTDAEFSFELKLKNYDELRLDGPPPMVPIILVVMLVPRDEGEWLSLSEAELAMKRCAYWVSLRGLPDSGNAVSQTVRLSRERLFSPQALVDLFRSIADGNWP